MITVKNIQKIELDTHYTGLALEETPRSFFTHNSKIDNRRTEEEDVIVGHLGEIAANLHYFGTEKYWLMARWIASQDPIKGDGGCDFPGAQLDVKSTCVTPRSTFDPETGLYYEESEEDLLNRLLRFHLLIRKKERIPGYTYVLALVVADRTEIKNVIPHNVYLIGWATEEMFPNEPEGEGVFRGAYSIDAKKLNPMMPMHWWPHRNKTFKQLMAERDLKFTTKTNEKENEDHYNDSCNDSPIIVRSKTNNRNNGGWNSAKANFQKY